MDNFKFASFCLFLSSSAIGITQDIKIQKIDIGIPSQAGLITGFTQDSDGYMWFTTAIGGVYQYDGYAINVFNNQPANPNSIASDRVECVAAGPEGVVWFGNYSKGLDRIDKATSGFRHFRHDSLNPNSLISDNVMTLLVDHTGILWIGTPSGLDRYDPSSDSFTHFHHDPDDHTSLSDDNISVIYEDKAGTIWVGTGDAFNGNEHINGGLNKLDRASGRFTRFVREADNPNSLVSNCITALFEDSRGVFWIGTAGDGLHSLNQKTGEITHHAFDPDHPEKLSRSAITPWAPWVADHITFINEDAYGGILIGTFGGGLSRYDPQRETVSRYPVFSDSTIYTRACWWSHRSRDGIFWMGTWLGGLYRIEAANSGLEYHTLGHTISKIYQQEPGLYWASTPEGLCRYDVVRKKKEVFTYPPRSGNGNSGERIITFAQNKEGEFWIGTFSGNIVLFNPETGIGKPYHRVQFNYPSSSYTINDIVLDQKQNIWIASGAGLEYMDTRTGQFTYYHDQTILPNSPREISTLMEDTKGNIWIGCFQEGGIHMLNIHDNTLHPFFGNKGVTSKLFQDYRGEIWVGANDGLYRLTDVNSDFSPFSFPHSDAIRVDDIMEDHDANLWVIRLSRTRPISCGMTSTFGNVGSNSV